MECYKNDFKKNVAINELIGKKTSIQIPKYKIVQYDQEIDIDFEVGQTLAGYSFIPCNGSFFSYFGLPNPNSIFICPTDNLEVISIVNNLRKILLLV